jgi:hypothetical protein
LKDRAFLDSVVERAASSLQKARSIRTTRHRLAGTIVIRTNTLASAGRSRYRGPQRYKGKTQAIAETADEAVVGSGFAGRLRLQLGPKPGIGELSGHRRDRCISSKESGVSPGPLSEIAALYNQAWQWLKADYSNERHLFNVFGFGRGNYGYINPTREWQQTGVGLGKLIVANHEFMTALEKEKLAEFPASPSLPEVARFEFFARSPERQEGVWLYRKGKFQFALPITVGTKPAVSDYLPIPYGLPGFAAPVEEVYQAMVPFLTLGDGKTYAASDGADEIEPGKGGTSLRIINRKWARIDSKPGERFENGLISDVKWRVENDQLIRTETITADRDTQIKRWSIAVPTTATRSQLDQEHSIHYRFEGREGSLVVGLKVPGDSSNPLPRQATAGWGKVF